MKQEAYELSEAELLYEVKKMNIAFIIDYDLTTRWVNAANADSLGQAGYATSGQLDKTLSWIKIEEKYFIQVVDLTKYLNFYLHHELASKGTTLRTWLAERSGTK
ncbi:MAG: hypothetical protein QXH32_05525 [Candidatus Caldarchaeum sp.]